MLANEVADALPFQRFSLEQGGCASSASTLDPDGVLREAAAGARAGVLAARQRCSRRSAAPLADGYCSELCLRAGPWLAALASTGGGAVLMFDYGLPRRQYYHAQRADGHAALPFPPSRAR